MSHPNGRKRNKPNQTRTERSHLRSNRQYKNSLKLRQPLLIDSFIDSLGSGRFFGASFRAAQRHQEDQHLQDGDDAGAEEQSQIATQQPWIQ